MAIFRRLVFIMILPVHFTFKLSLNPKERMTILFASSCFSVTGVSNDRISCMLTRPSFMMHHNFNYKDYGNHKLKTVGSSRNSVLLQDKSQTFTTIRSLMKGSCSPLLFLNGPLC